MGTLVSRLQRLSDAAASKATEAAKVYAELGEILAALGRELANLDTRPPPGTGYGWTPAEERILTSVYPTRGYAETQKALTAAGHPFRTASAIYSRAKHLGCTSGNGPKGPTGKDRVVEVVRHYRGLPLTIDDVRAEVGNLSERRARKLLQKLESEGVIASRLVEHGGVAYYDHTAIQEAA